MTDEFDYYVEAHSEDIENEKCESSLIVPIESFHVFNEDTNFVNEYDEDQDKDQDKEIESDLEEDYPSTPSEETFWARDGDSSNDENYKNEETSGEEEGIYYGEDLDEYDQEI